jgi:hypothetical protein
MKRLYFLLALMPFGFSFSQPAKSHLANNFPLSGGLSVQIIDLTQKFLKFYDSAATLDAEARWQLWKKIYGFAAVPPGPAGDKMARTLLDNAWPKYPGVIGRIRQGAGVLNPAPLDILKRVAKLLNADTLQDSIKVKLYVFVGGLENNAFAFPDHGVPAVAIPVEIDNKELELTMTHEFTHAVHIKIADHIWGSYPTTLATLVLMEGLAMRTTEQLVPGHTPEIYTNAHSDTWLKECEQHRAVILKGIRQHLTDSASEARAKFIYGDGTSGHQREAYYAGWIIVGQLQKQGMTLSDLARLSPASVHALLNKTIGEMIKD